MFNDCRSVEWMVRIDSWSSIRFDTLLIPTDTFIGWRRNKWRRLKGWRGWHLNSIVGRTKWICTWFPFPFPPIWIRGCTKHNKWPFFEVSSACFFPLEKVQEWERKWVKVSERKWVSEWVIRRAKWKKVRWKRERERKWCVRNDSRYCVSRKCNFRNTYREREKKKSKTNDVMNRERSKDEK